MTNSKAIGFGLAMAGTLLLAAISPTQIAAETKKPIAPPNAFDCADTSIKYADDPTLTPAEKIALMDRALMNSLNRFDACQSSRANSRDAGSGSEGGSGGGGKESVANTDVAGTEDRTALMVGQA